MPIRAAIIGAGISGLIATKECLDADIEPVCFEAQGHIGGQWRYTELDPKTGDAVSSIYRSLVINTARETMCMSDFPMDPKKYAIYAHHTKVLDYFESYASYFNLYPHIRFYTKVLSITPQPDNKWLVQTVSGDGVVREQVFDSVFVCSGHHTKPNLPEWEGVDAFRKNGGELMHSHYYRSPEPFIGKKVAVVGIGNTGADLSSDLSGITSEMHLITRSGAWIWPRFLLGKAYEGYLSRFMMRVVPTFIGLVITQWSLVMINGVIPPQLRPKHNLLGAHPTVRSDLIERINQGVIKPHRASISRFTETGIELTNGEKIEPLDKVVACTGYQINFPYLAREIYKQDTDDLNWAHLYRMVVPPEHPTIFFIGLVQPLGAIMPVSEQQARWATSVLNGHISLPPTPTMHQHVEEYKSDSRRRFINSPRHTMEVDYLAYNDTLARDIGNEITPWRFIQTFGLLQGIKAMVATYFAIPCPAQYRLFGRGSKSEFARLCMQRVHDGLDPMSEEEWKALGEGR